MLLTIPGVVAVCSVNGDAPRPADIHIMQVVASETEKKISIDTM